MTVPVESALSDPRFPPPPPETASERKSRLIALFVMPFLIVTMMYATYVGTTHDQTPADLPVAVVGAGQQAETFASELEKNADGRLDVSVLADADDLDDLFASGEIAGAIELPGARGEAAVIHTAGAAGAAQSSLASQLLTPAVIGAQWAVETVDHAPLPERDMAGTMVMFAAMGMMLAGYVPLSGMLGGTPNLLRVRKFAPLALGWSLLTSTLLWLIMGPLVGAVEGNFLTFVGVGTLATSAVLFSTLLLTKVMGPFAVLMGMLLFVIFGTQASNLGMSIHTMPGFFGWLHGVLPMPAAGEALRSAIYFDGQNFWGHIGVLAAWLVIAALLCLRKDMKSDAPIMAGPLYTHPDAPLAALAGGPVATYRKRLIAVAAFPLTIVVTVVTLMSFSMTKPELKDFPVAVVGSTTAAAEQFVAATSEGLGDIAELTVIDSVDAGEELLKDSEIAAVFVLPTAEGGPATLVVAGGGGQSQIQIAQQILGGVAAGMGVELTVDDIAPLGEDDTNGNNSLYIGMSWIMAGFLFFAVLRGGAPDLTRTRQLLPLVAGWSVGISLWFWFLYDVLIGAIDGHFVSMVGLGALTTFSVAWATAVVTRVIGLFGIIPAMVIVMLAGVPASGGGMPLAMVPGIFDWFNQVLPLPAAVEIARSLVYFDGTGVGANVVTIVIWGAVGLVLNFLVVDPYIKRFAKPHAPLGPKAIPERGERTKKRSRKPADSATDAPAEAGESEQTESVPV